MIDVIFIKYDQSLTNDNFTDFCHNYLVGRIYKLLPLKENNQNWEVYLHSLLSELSGTNALLLNNKYFFVLLSKLESLNLLENHSDFRKVIFESITYTKSLPEKIVGDNS